MVLLTSCTRHKPAEFQQIIQLDMTKKRLQLWDMSGTAYQSVITSSVAAKNCNNFSHNPQYRVAEESIPNTIPKCLKCNMDNLRQYKGTGCRISAWR